MSAGSNEKSAQKTGFGFLTLDGLRYVHMGVSARFQLPSLSRTCTYGAAVPYRISVSPRHVRYMVGRSERACGPDARTVNFLMHASPSAVHPS
jgi:hypothetical protein